MENWQEVQEEIELLREVVLVDGVKRDALLSHGGRTATRIKLQCQMHAENVCTSCSICCEQIGRVVITQPDVERIAASLGIPQAQFQATLGQDDNRHYLQASPCEFLQAGLCSIYEVRPTLCVIYPFLANAPESDTIGLHADCNGRGQL